MGVACDSGWSHIFNADMMLNGKVKL